MPEITVAGWKCNRCGYEWAKKKKKDGSPLIPEVCASCHNPYWNRDRLE